MNVRIVTTRVVETVQMQLEAGTARVKLDTT